MSATSKSDDWHLRGQEKYLLGASLVRRSYRRYAGNREWDHDHCAFCWAKFMVEDHPGVLHEGYATPDDYHWICDQCFSEFRDRFQWQLISDAKQKT